MVVKTINAVGKSVLIISDQHAPYHFKDTIKFLKEVKKLCKPDIIINLGDEIDNSAISFHDNDVSLFSAGQELEKAIEYLHDLHSLFPKMYLLTSNHGSLIYRRMKHHGIPMEHLKSMQELYGTPLWNWYDELLVKTEHDLPTYFCHGKTGAYNKLAREQGCNAVSGHFHSKFELTWAKSTTSERYNMFCGCLIDHDSLAFAYGKNHLPKPILGCGFIDVIGVPHLIKVPLNDDGRFEGDLWS